MPETIDWPPPSRPFRRFLLLAVVFALVLFFGGRALSYYVDALWFGSLGYEAVFRKMLGLQWALFAVSALVTFALLYGAFVSLRKAHHDDLPSRRAIVVNGQTVSLNIEPLLRPLGLLVSGLVAFLTGSGVMSEWPAFARFLYAPHAAAAVLDPIFGRSINFYLLRLPALEMITDWLVTVAVLTVGMAVLFLFLTARTRVPDARFIGSARARWRGLSIALAFLLLMIAARLYLSRFEYLMDDHTVFSGVSFVDAHIVLTGLLFTCLALVIGAAIALYNAFKTSSPRLLVAAVLPSISLLLHRSDHCRACLQLHRENQMSW